MNEHKSYLEQLLLKHKINIEKNHRPLLDSFVKDETIIKSFNLIQNTQLTMIDKWKEKTQVEDIKTKQIVLTNGTVGKPYEFIFDFAQLKLLNIGDYNVEIDEKIGVTFNKTENKISGVFKEAGEHTLIFNFKLKNQIEEKPFIKKELKLIVNPDPKSLWVEKESDKNDKYWKEDFASAHSSLSSKQLVIASKRGRSHAQEGIFRDDDFSYSFFEDSGWGVIVVADGAGSAKYSRKGSLIACNEIVDYFKNIDKEKLKEIEDSIQENFKEATEENQKKLSGYFIEQLGKAAFAAQGKIREEATANNAVIKDYSTTLIFALVKKYENKFVIASFWVGDGGIGIYNKDKNEVFVLGTPDSGEFAGQTRFLTMSDIFADGAYASRVRFKIVEDFTALILMTDGITDPKFQTDNNLNRIEKWNELWSDLIGNNQDNCKVDFSKPINEVEIELLNWLDFWSPGNHDDRTIAILY
jgi:serine/threonine protein phosphatase PrpC